MPRMRKKFSGGAILTLVLMAAAKVVQFLLDDGVSAKEMMCTVPGLIFTALVIYGATNPKQNHFQNR